jgi:dsDNA-specific endonuclease/ATPase MutS2
LQLDAFATGKVLDYLSKLATTPFSGELKQVTDHLKKKSLVNFDELLSG